MRASEVVHEGPAQATTPTTTTLAARTPERGDGREAAAACADALDRARARRLPRDHPPRANHCAEQRNGGVTHATGTRRGLPGNDPWVSSPRTSRVAAGVDACGQARTCAQPVAQRDGGGTHATGCWDLLRRVGGGVICEHGRMMAAVCVGGGHRCSRCPHWPSRLGRSGCTRWPDSRRRLRAGRSCTARPPDATVAGQALSQ